MPDAPILTSGELMDFIRHLDRVADLYNNHDTLRREAAITAAQLRRPAYWTTERYYNQPALLLCSRLNHGDSPHVALSELSADAPWARTKAFLVSTIIPLNREAVLVHQELSTLAFSTE